MMTTREAIAMKRRELLLDALSILVDAWTSTPASDSAQKINMMARIDVLIEAIVKEGHDVAD